VREAVRDAARDLVHQWLPVGRPGETGGWQQPAQCDDDANQQSRQQREIPARLVRTRGLAPQGCEQGKRDDVQQQHRTLGQDAEPDAHAQRHDASLPLPSIEVQQRMQCAKHAQRQQQVEHDRGAEQREPETPGKQPHRRVGAVRIHPQPRCQPTQDQQHGERYGQRLDTRDPGMHAEDFPAARDQPEQ
jgi:hypothetical protein